jgi:SAM-dependent methyltransferase
MSDEAQPSEEELWAGPMGERWLAHVARFEGMLEPAGAALIDKANIRSGEQVLDFGCGAGATTVDIARRVAPQGRVTGLDISPVLVAAARNRSLAVGLDNTDFILGDAATVDLERATYDCLFSRFGNMFFHDPYTAFAHLHECLKPIGRLALCCWGPVTQNIWMMEIRAVLARHVELPPPVPRAPGPFAFGDPVYLGDILAKAGFRAATFDLWQSDQLIGGPGGDPNSVARFMLEAMPVGAVLAEASEAVRTAVQSDLTALFECYRRPAGVTMPAAAWLVTARGS